MIYGCYKKVSGQLRVVDDHSQCSASEFPILLYGEPISSHAVVFCDQGQSIQEAVDRAPSPASIEVHGTCNEAIEIQKDRINIYTNSGATIIPPPEGAAFTVRNADNVEIAGFNITGGKGGVGILNGSTARVSNNMITGSTHIGITLSDNSHADLWQNQVMGSLNLGDAIINGSVAALDGNTITGSSDIGIFISEKSQAHLYHNEVMRSGAGGIWIRGSSQASISQNTITGNTDDGISVVMGSSANVMSNNVITENGNHGIKVQTNGTLEFFGTNEIGLNGVYGISCESSGVMVVVAAQDFDGNGAGAVEIVTDPHPPCFVWNPDGVPFP
jgi:parallel beta-helix repeat protein